MGNNRFNLKVNGNIAEWAYKRLSIFSTVGLMPYSEDDFLLSHNINYNPFPTEKLEKIDLEFAHVKKTEVDTLAMFCSSPPDYLIATRGFLGEGTLTSFSLFKKESRQLFERIREMIGLEPISLPARFLEYFSHIFNSSEIKNYELAESKSSRHGFCSAYNSFNYAVFLKEYAGFSDDAIRERIRERF